MTATFRFAPSPTGRLHIGNIRTAVINWLLAEKAGGRVILRLDDTDRSRSTEAFAAAIRDDLAWLGLRADEEARQSDRFARYDAAAERLRQAGRLYPCWETQEELELKRKRQLARGLPPVYDRAALGLSDEDRRRLEEERGAPHWRFLLERSDVSWPDLVRGEQHIDAASLSDPVLRRADGTWLYTLPSVVDDIELGVTHVVRGEDHVANTAPQIQLFGALGGAIPQFGHHTLLVASDGGALSKRAGALSIASMREEGIEPMAIVSLAATLGSSEPVAPFADFASLAAAFDIARQSRAPARFDMAVLRNLNARLLQRLDYDAVAARLEREGIGGGRPFWDAVRDNIATLSEASSWWRVTDGDIERVIRDSDLVAEAARLLPEEPWDDRTWSAWTKSVAAATGRSGGALFKPLRLALTGRDQGPEMRLLLPLIGRAQALKRLEGG
jgi:glutamyl-tRNA synthetase